MFVWPLRRGLARLPASFKPLNWRITRQRYQDCSFRPTDACASRARGRCERTNAQYQSHRLSAPARNRCHWHHPHPII